MVAVLGFVIFAGALGVSVGVIAAMIAPRWERIVRLATGHIEPDFLPLTQLAVAERRIAVRSWATRRRVNYTARTREAA